MDSTKLYFIYKKKQDYVHSSDFHSHPGTELVFYFKGSGTLIMDNNKYEFDKDCVSVINPGVVHSETHITPSCYTFICFEFEHFQIPDGLYRPKNFSKLKLIIEEILTENNSPKYGHNIFLSAKINELMTLLVRDIISYNSHDKTNDCMFYIKEHCCENIDLKELAEKHSLRYETFRHRFKKIYGMSPKSFMVTQRLQKSCELLSDSKMSCIDIAYKCGFSNSSQFSNLFKRQYGISPQEYRKINKH